MSDHDHRLAARVPGTADRMEHVEAVAHIPVDADELWRTIGSFQRVGEWHPWLASVHGDGEQPGARRTAIGTDGSEQVERLQEVDPVGREYRYVMESSAMPVRDYQGALRVEDHGDGTSSVCWSSDFETTRDRDDTIEMVRGFLETGVQTLAQRYRNRDAP